MKTAITLLLLLYSTVAFSHTANEEADYLIIFGNCFEKDTISLKINNVPIFNEYKMGNEPSHGNLSLKQSADGIHIFHNGQKKSRVGIDFTFYLDLEIKINQETAKFKLDLRKGKVVVFEKCAVPAFSKSPNKLKMEQMAEPFLLM